MVNGQLSRIQNLINIWLEIFVIIIFEVILSSDSVICRDVIAVAFLAEKDKFISASFRRHVAIILDVVDIPVACYRAWTTRDLEAWRTHVGLHEPGAFVGSSKRCTDRPVSISRCNGTASDASLHLSESWNNSSSAKVSSLSARDHSEFWRLKILVRTPPRSISCSDWCCVAGTSTCFQHCA